MKKIYCLLAIISLLSSCTKTSTPATNNGSGNNNNNSNNNNNNNNNSGNLTITSIMPTNPYPDDEFTVNGTGFDADASKDTVEFGRLTNNAFGAWHDGLESEWASLCSVVSATSTSLVIKAVNPVGLDYAAFNTSTSSIAVIKIRAGGKSVVSPLIPFKRIFLLNGINDPDRHISYGAANDSLEIYGKGFSAQGMNVSIDQVALTDFKVDNNPNSGTITLRLSKTFFGESNDDNLVETRTVTLTAPDGKSIHKDFNFYMSPRMYVNSIEPEQSVYSKSGLNGSGGVINITVTGVCLKSDVTVKIGAIGYTAESGLQVSGFPNSTVITLSPGALPLGNITVSLWRGNTFYNSCSFKIVT